MSELQDMLRVQARLHRKQGANALGQLFESAIEEIQLLKKTYNQLFDAFQDCQGELAKANERESVLSCQLDSHIERVAELEKENKRESMELRSRLGSALGRNSEYNSTIENMQHKLAKANERVKELEHGNRACAIAIRELVERGDIEHLMVGNDALDKIVNKFAIEKKIEALKSFASYAKGDDWEDAYLQEAIKIEIEQLRKEQE